MSAYRSRPKVYVVIVPSPTVDGAGRRDRERLAASCRGGDRSRSATSRSRRELQAHDGEQGAPQDAHQPLGARNGGDESRGQSSQSTPTMRVGGASSDQDQVGEVGLEAGVAPASVAGQWGSGGLIGVSRGGRCLDRVPRPGPGSGSPAHSVLGVVAGFAEAWPLAEEVGRHRPGGRRGRRAGSARRTKECGSFVAHLDQLARAPSGSVARGSPSRSAHRWPERCRAGGARRSGRRAARVVRSRAHAAGTMP